MSVATLSSCTISVNIRREKASLNRQQKSALNHELVISDKNHEIRPAQSNLLPSAPYVWKSGHNGSSKD